MYILYHKIRQCADIYYLKLYFVLPMQISVYLFLPLKPFDFTAEKPNSKWLTDIIEFAIPAGKVYLSPIVDCFDGLLVS